MLTGRSLPPLLLHLPHHHKMMVVVGEQAAAVAVGVEMKSVREAATMAVGVIETVIAVRRMLWEEPCQESVADRLSVKMAHEEAG